MVSQKGLQEYLHLVAIPADRSHDPQAFQMRWDQPMRSFRRAYGNFRGFSPQRLEALQMTTSASSTRPRGAHSQSHGGIHLDPLGTPGSYGLADGAEVVFSGIPCATTGGAKLQLSQQLVLAEPSSTKRSQSVGVVVSPAAVRRTPRPRSSDVSSLSFELASPSKKPLFCPVKTCSCKQAKKAGYLREDQLQRHLLECHPKSLLARSLISGATANSGDAKVGCVGRASAVSSRATSIGKGRGRGRSTTASAPTFKKVKAAAVSQHAKSKLKGKLKPIKKTAAKMGVKTKGKPVIKAKAKSKSKSKAKLAARGPADLQAPAALVKVKDEARDRATEARETRWSLVASEGRAVAGIPLLTDHRRSSTIQVGPAKGWRVTAYLEDITGQKIRGRYDTTVRWKILSPDRSRLFDRFKGSKSKKSSCLEGAVSDAVYTQIHTAVRPELERTLKQRRLEIEGLQKEKRPRWSSKSLLPKAPAALQDQDLRTTCASDPAYGSGSGSVGRGFSSAAAAVSSRLASGGATHRLERYPPQPLMMSSQRQATKPHLAVVAPSFLPSARGRNTLVQAPSRLWDCLCEGHLRRHPRCTTAESLQPEVIHLLGSPLLVGRGESCDIVLDSSRTPQMISRSHAAINYEEAQDEALHAGRRRFSVLDQGSVNGVYVNGQRLDGKLALSDGDVVTFGAPTSRPEFDYIFDERPDARCTQ